jgi:Ulp1 family protease
MKDWQHNIKKESSNWMKIHGATPKQNNNYDCGPWILETAKHLLFGKQRTFREEEMQKIRKTQTNELRTKTIELKQKRTNKVRKKRNHSYRQIKMFSQK